jgi:D-amino-acid dehydrogenase
MKPTLIIGGGIVGLFSAYFLQKEGIEVTIIDRADLSENCSTGNAGMIVPSHIIPLAAPGMISKGISWMFSSKSPFYIHPKLDFKLAKWCLLFFKAANQSQVKRAIPFLKNLSILSKSLYLDFKLDHPEAALALQEKGLMMAYQTETIEHEETEFALLARTYGLEAEILTPDDLHRVEPHLELKARGAVLFPGDAHLDPAALYSFLRAYLEKKGVKFQTNCEVQGFEKSGSKVSAVITTQGKIDADKIVLCGGSWSGELARQLGFYLPMMGGKGYSFLQQNKPQIMQATILTEQKVAVSPYGDESINRYYPDFQAKFPEEKGIWKGLRPCSPDGLPYIGFAPGYDNVLVGSGHSMMGVSLAPATGKILAELHRQKDTSIEIQGFEVGRYS